MAPAVKRLCLRSCTIFVLHVQRISAAGYRPIHVQVGLHHTAAQEAESRLG